MGTWNTFTAMTSAAEIRVDLLEHGGQTAGWIVRRSCGVWMAWLRPPGPEREALDLERDGLFLGVAPEAEDARQLVLDALGIAEPQLEAPAAEPVTI